MIGGGPPEYCPLFQDKLKSLRAMAAHIADRIWLPVGSAPIPGIVGRPRRLPVGSLAFLAQVAETALYLLLSAPRNAIVRI